MQWTIVDGEITRGVVACEKRFWSAFVQVRGGIDDDKLSNAMVTKGVAKIYTVYGIVGGKETRSAYTSITTGKNIGKANETTPLLQAMKQVESMYAKKMRAGYVATENSVIDRRATKVLFPMALHTWTKYRSRIVYPSIVQPKLDGVRCVANWNADTQSVDLYTRRGKPIVGFTDITNELHAILERYQTVHFDGELYRHGMLLQEISGIVRGNVTSDKTKLTFMIFDCFDTSRPLWSCEDRHEWIEQTCGNLTRSHIVETQVVDSEEDSDVLMDAWSAQGYEGMVYKTPSAVYEWGEARERRSSKYIKRKRVEDGEFRIVGYTNGVGKFADMIVFELETSSGHKFNCVPMGTSDYRRTLLREAREDFSKFNNLLAKVKYDALSASGIPVRAQITQVGRDVAFD